MQVNLIVQRDGINSLYQNISSNMSSAKKIYVICGTVKESGFEILEENLIDTKIKSYFIIGIDKKNTTKNMLEAMLKLSKDVFCYNNNLEVEFNSNIIIIEGQKKANMFFSACNISDFGLSKDLSVYEEIVFDLSDANDKIKYKEKIKEITSIPNNDNFFLLTKEMITDLIEAKEIFSTKQYNHSVMSISELLSKKNEEKDKVDNGKCEIDDGKNIEVPKIDLSDIDLDIELPEVEVDSLKKENKNDELKIDVPEDFDTINTNDIVSNVLEEPESGEHDMDIQNDGLDYETPLDINDLLFEKADMKLTKHEESSEEENQNDDEKLEVKKVNLNNVSNLIIELPSRPTKGRDLKNIKIPNYIKQMIPEFFALNSSVKNEMIDGSMYKYKNIKIEIVVVNTSEKFTDRNAKLMQKQGQTYITFTTSAFENVEYSEGDIVRIIKLSDDVYHIEVISKEMNEYKIWDKVCNQKMKSSDRKFGMM